MKNSKIFLLEKHLNDAIAANPKRDLYMHLRAAKKVVVAITDPLRDGNPKPPTVTAFERELAHSRNKMESLPAEKRPGYLADLLDRHPDAKDDGIAWDEANAALLAGETEVKFESKPSGLAWKNDVCQIPIEAFDALLDAGIFTEE
jgi:hypothetical protein